MVEQTEDGIVLGIQDNGITCQLSRQLPDYIETGVGPIVERFLASHELTRESIDLWAVHPGGTRIIEKSQRSLGLSDSQVADSWEILRQYGNMLSPRYCLSWNVCCSDLRRILLVLTKNVWG